MTKARSGYWGLRLHKRGMYIGTTDGRAGALVYEIVDNSIDERWPVTAR